MKDNHIIKGKLQIEVSVVEHCNLNCAHCDHFAPLANEEFLSLDVFERDIKRCAELFGADQKYITLLGGETLLHPDIAQFIRIARKYYQDQKTAIIVYSNGLKVNSMPEDFWAAMQETGAQIALSEYDIPLDYKTVEDCIIEHGVKYFYQRHRKDPMLRNMLDKTGSQNPQLMFENCYHGGVEKCTTLKNGKLYCCPIASTIYHYENYFNEHIAGDVPENGIDIYTHTADEIYEFLSKPIQLCKYCRVLDRFPVPNYRQSTKNKSEW